MTTQLRHCPAAPQARMMEVSADLEAADERNTETERALAEAKAEADEYHGHLQQLMDAQRRITEQLAEREAENEASPWLFGHTGLRIGSNMLHTRQTRSQHAGTTD
jgi:chromosome segregation ATPase